MSAPKRGYAPFTAGQIHYAEAGDGPPLLLLHSAPRSSRAYRLMLPRLAGGFRAIAPDLPGFGASDPLAGAVTMDALADAMVELLDALGVAKAHVFGYHTGNKVAAAMAARHPARIDRLILCGQIHSIIPEKAKRDGAIANIVDKYFIDYPGVDAPLRRWQAEWSDVCGFAQPRALFAQPAVSAQDVAALKVRVLDHVQALDAVRATYAANFDFDYAGALARIRAPTLHVELVMPDEEHYGRQLQKLCALVPGSTGATIIGAGKTAPESHVAELAEHIERFCGGRLPA